MAPCFDQQVCRFHVAGPRDREQRGLPIEVRRVSIGAGIQQQLDHRGVSDFGSESHRRHAVVIRELDVRSGLEQSLCLGDVVAVDGPLQRCAAVHFAPVDVGGRGLCCAGNSDGRQEDGNQDCATDSYAPRVATARS